LPDINSVIAVLSPIFRFESGSVVLVFFVLVSAFTAGYKHIECHQDRCHRLGRFQHGHLKLCGVHHPLVPNDGKISAEQIDAVTKAKDH